MAGRPTAFRLYTSSGSPTELIGLLPVESTCLLAGRRQGVKVKSDAAGRHPPRRNSGGERASKRCNGGLTRVEDEDATEQLKRRFVVEHQSRDRHLAVFAVARLTVFAAFSKGETDGLRYACVGFARRTDQMASLDAEPSPLESGLGALVDVQDTPSSVDQDRSQVQPRAGVSDGARARMPALIGPVTSRVPPSADRASCR